MSRPGGCLSTDAGKLPRPRRCRIPARLIPSHSRYKAIRTLGAIVLGLSSSAILAPKAEASDVQYKTFENIVAVNGVGSKVLESYIAPDWTSVDNLKIRTDYTDASGNSDEVVSKTGYRDSTTGKWVGEKWDAGFFSVTGGGGFQFGAYASNDNFNSNLMQEDYPGYMSGWLEGLIYVDVFPVGARPDGMILNHNVDGLGGVPVVGGTIIDFSKKKTSDSFYGDFDILYGEKQLRADTTILPALFWNGQPAILPKMIISPYSEIPIENRGARATYYNGIRDDPANLLDVLALAENWLSNDCGPTNYWCDGADWNTDGKVTLADWALLSSQYERDE